MQSTYSEMESYTELVRRIEQAPELLEDVGELVRLVPYAKHVVAAYRWIRTKRIKRFLRSLDAAASEMSDHERKRFQSIIESEAGGELLAEYADAVLRTSSKVVISALALLYSDADDEVFTRSFKLTACLALEGMADRLIEVFLELSSLPPTSEGGPYSVLAVGESVMSGSPKLQSLCPTVADRAACINELIRRGLFLPGEWSGRQFGPEVISFGISETTIQFRELLAKANRLASGPD